MNNKICFFLSLVVMFFFNQSIFGQTDINQLDEKGKKHGVWKGYYPESKRLRYEGTFEHGKEIGVFKFYDDVKSQPVIATREFNAKDNSVYTIFYNQSKNKVSEGKQVNKRNEGEWKYYHENLPDIMIIEHYKAGKLEGKRMVFYRSSGIKGEENIAEEANYKNGLKNGNYKKYTMKGTVLEDSNYKKGQLDGPAIFNDPLGNLVSKGNFKNGKKSGIWEFYQDGKLIKKENMDKTKRRKPTPPKANPIEN
jgi:antitoxin component YwqK of YwqJK toxin-antitoxin module